MELNQDVLTRWLIAIAIVVGAWLLGALLRKLVVSRLTALVSRSKTDFDDLVLEALRPHVPLWFLIGGAVVGARYAQVPQHALFFIDRGAEVLFIVSGTLALATFLARVVATRSSDRPDAAATTSLAQTTVRIVVIGLGAMVVVTNLGIAITPILTALGVGSLAVALALQPTLANLFAGFHITLARKIRVGDYIELESGQKGYVVDIDWRSTTIRQLANNLVVVPNSRIAEIIVTNYAMPSDEQSCLVQVGVHYASNLQHVEEVTIATARAVQRDIEGAVAEHEPFIRYHTFGDSSINFSVILRVRTFVDRYLTTHEFVKRLHVAYDQAGIEIPFPQRVVHMATNGAEPYAGAGSQVADSAVTEPQEAQD